MCCSGRWTGKRILNSVERGDLKLESLTFCAVNIERMHLQKELIWNVGQDSPLFKCSTTYYEIKEIYGPAEQ